MVNQLTRLLEPTQPALPTLDSSTVRHNNCFFHLESATISSEDPKSGEKSDYIRIP
jgi:hypothetical protein